jgi:hypothetical protein
MKIHVGQGPAGVQSSEPLEEDDPLLPREPLHCTGNPGILEPTRIALDEGIEWK